MMDRGSYKWNCNPGSIHRSTLDGSMKSHLAFYLSYSLTLWQYSNVPVGPINLSELIFWLFWGGRTTGTFGVDHIRVGESELFELSKTNFVSLNETAEIRKRGSWKWVLVLSQDQGPETNCDVVGVEMTTPSRVTPSQQGSLGFINITFHWPIWISKLLLSA